ncbi:MAG: hypothetical protein L0312_15385, partial [Acidobacteria bacterium]|nr:hypothetical protein [Acidobacteriota bacterium]
FAMGAVAVILLIYRFANIREEWLVQRFLDELKLGNFQQAYRIWGPTKGYTYQDFMADWGGSGYYGKIGPSRILESKTEGSGVIVLVEFSHLKRPVALWVERRTRMLAFSPIETLR